MIVSKPTRRLSALPPMPESARRHLAGRMTSAILRVFGADAVAAIILKGSAFKGDFVPGYSDLDVHIFVGPAGAGRMLDARTPSLEVSLVLQETLNRLGSKDVGVNGVQVFVIDAARYPADWNPPIPGTYEVLHGVLPWSLPAPDAETALAEAKAVLEAAPLNAQGLLGRILDKPDARLPAFVRLLGGYIKPAVYSAAMLRGAPPLEVWLRPLGEVLLLVEPAWCPSGDLTAFFLEVWDWPRVSSDPTLLRRVFRLGYRALLELCNHARAYCSASTAMSSPSVAAIFRITS